MGTGTFPASRTPHPVSRIPHPVSRIPESRTRLRLTSGRLCVYGPVMPMPLPKNNRIPPGAQAAIGLGYSFAAGIIVFAGLGYWFDRKRGEDKVLFTILGLFLGLFYGGYETWKIVRSLQGEPSSDRTDPRENHEN